MHKSSVTVLCLPDLIYFWFLSSSSLGLHLLTEELSDESCTYLLDSAPKSGSSMYYDILLLSFCGVEWLYFLRGLRPSKSFTSSSEVIAISPNSWSLLLPWELESLDRQPLYSFSRLFLSFDAFSDGFVLLIWWILLKECCRYFKNPLLFLFMFGEMPELETPIENEEELLPDLFLGMNPSLIICFFF